MNKRILKRYSLGVLCLMGSLVGCYSEQPTNDSTHPIGKPVEVRLQVNAPLGSTAIASESAIKRLRMVVFSSVDNSDAGKLILNKYYPTVPPSNILEETITSGRRDIYLIANEPLGGGGEELDGYKKIATVADMRKLSLAYLGTSSVGSYTPSEIPMFVEHLKEQLEVDATSTIGGTVERTMAKVTLNLNVKNDNFTPGKQVVIDHIIIKNLPKSSFLIPQNYTGELVASEKQAVGVVNAVSGYDRSTTNTFYVPEYLFDKLDKGAYIEITGHVNGDPSRVAKYSVKLGDAMGGEPYSDKYHITRNRHYTFTGDVKSYGEMDGVAVEVKVAPWNTVDMSEEVGHYIAFDKMTDGTNNTIVEGSNLSDMGTTINVHCNTNTGGWYTVTKDENGDILEKSNSTASVSGATSQTVSITIPPIREMVYGKTYTVSIYHPTIAKELVGSVKALRFTQYGGFIPNSVLKDAGWVDNLPTNGLQLAKRGNKVLPDGVAGSNDARIQWKITHSSTGGTYMDLGMGAISTDAMKGPEHPAAQYCRDMGEKGWFLPSIKELELLYANKLTLGTSYSYEDGDYWSASQQTDAHVWYVTFPTFGTHNNATGNDNCRVRCVKAI